MIGGTVARAVRPRLSRGFSQVLAEPMAWNQSPGVVTKLSNGVRVATKESFGEVATVGVYIDAGVRNETPDMIGASHLIEKLALTGTATRSKSDLANEVECMGALLDVSVGRERTSFSATVSKGDLKQGLSLLADMVANPGVANLEREREAIIRALEECDQPTRAVINDRLHRCAFRDGGLGYSAVGPFDDLDKISAEHLQTYVASNYRADKIVVAASGPVNHDELVKLASSAFGSLSTSPQGIASDKPYFCGADLNYRNDEMGPTAYVSVGWEGVPYKSPDAVAFMLMSAIIGKYEAGKGLVPGKISGNRVVNAVANKMQVGCASEFDSFNLFYKDTGMFGVYGVCDEVAVEHCVGELMYGVNLLSCAVTEEEVARGKRELISSLFSGSGSTAVSCSELGNHVLSYGRSIPAAEMILRINAIDAEEIKRVAYKYLNDAEIAVSCLGPLHGLPHYMELRRATQMVRY